MKIMKLDISGKTNVLWSSMKLVRYWRPPHFEREKCFYYTF